MSVDRGAGAWAHDQNAAAASVSGGQAARPICAAFRKTSMTPTVRSMSIDAQSSPGTFESMRAIDKQSSPPADSGPSDAEKTAPSLLARFAILLVRQYQFWLGPLLGGRCRFYPSCSEYSVLAVQKHGFWRGALKTIIRLCKCQPFHPGGVDFP